jgi:uncharacterized protein (TIGR02147 family)
MLTWIFQEKSYKTLIKKLIAESPTKRGMITKLAEHISCQRSYLSQVLHLKAHLNRDQIWAISQYFALGKNETLYFELLFEHARAGSTSYRQQIEIRLRDCRKQAEQLIHRFAEKSQLEQEKANLYYASWIPSAVHILSSIPNCREAGDFAGLLGLSVKSINKVLAVLEQMGLVERHRNAGWRISGETVFIPRTSAYVALHHQNWRALAVDDARMSESDGIHYTMVQSMGRQDYERLKTMILEFIDASKQIAEPSPSEMLTAMSIDWFEPGAAFR